MAEIDETVFWVSISDQRSESEGKTNRKLEGKIERNKNVLNV